MMWVPPLFKQNLVFCTSLLRPGFDHKRFFFHFFYRNKLSTWISKCAESTYAKSGGTATKLRDEGNAKFRLHDNDGSIRVYTESIICSPEYGPELSLAFGNRSAALYHAGQFEDSLKGTYCLYVMPKLLKFTRNARIFQTSRFLIQLFSKSLWLYSILLAGMNK